MSDEKTLLKGLTQLGAGIDKLKSSQRTLATSLREMLSYAESRIEDMEENVATAPRELKSEARAHLRQARIRFVYAQRALAKFDAESRS